MVVGGGGRGERAALDEGVVAVCGFLANSMLELVEFERPEWSKLALLSRTFGLMCKNGAGLVGVDTLAVDDVELACCSCCC